MCNVFYYTCIITSLYVDGMLCVVHSWQVSSALIVIGNVPSTAPAAAATESSATASVCRVCSAQHAISLVQPELGAQTASICVTAPYSNTLPVAIQRFE